MNTTLRNAPTRFIQNLCLAFTLMTGLSTEAIAQREDKAKDVTPLKQHQLKNACRKVTDDINATPARFDIRLARQCELETPVQGTYKNTEVLLIERHREPKNVSANAPKRADVYTYDYRNNTLRHDVVNTVTGEIDWSETSSHVQLPLSPNEVLRSVDLVVQDEEIRTRIEQEYRDLVGQDLADISQLNIRAFILVSEVGSNTLNNAADQCGHHRCAQLSFDSNGIAFEISPLVNLSKGEVVHD